jgi:DNA-binding response OmpR family regulator
MAHVLVVDDDARLSGSIARALREQNYRCTVCNTSGLALDLIGREMPDVAILDVSMPGLSGLELCRKIREQLSPDQLPILFLSAWGLPEDRIAGLEAGGDDYLAKPFNVRELELRVSGLLRRSGRGQEQQEELFDVSVRDLRLDAKTFRALVGPREVPLTPVEYELLRYLMLRAGEVVSAEQLLQEVWRYYPGTGDAAVVRVQIMNLRDKIEQDRRQPRYITTIYRHGYMIPA